jgi:ubiquinone/menaquinone biosynthesis C-methylase UbiE
VTKNIDEQVVDDFGREWARFDQTGVSINELEKIFNQYFSIFPWEKLPQNAQGFDLGCGSGRWAYFCAAKVGKLHCVDPATSALAVAKKKLSKYENCEFHVASVDEIPLMDDSMDFGYSLGVLHHVPDTGRGISACVKKLKPNAPFLIYLYYAFDNRSPFFKAIWQVSDVFRRFISVSPYPLKYFFSQVIAFLVYFPLSRLARVLENIGVNVSSFPLSDYRDKSLYTLRTDALDRFGTRLESRFTRKQILEMMLSAGLKNVVFSDESPYWCAVGYKSTEIL